LRPEYPASLRVLTYSEENLMSQPRTLPIVATLMLASAILCTSAQAEQADKKMSFFATSANPGKGADLGGLAGADRYCQSLAAAVGAGQRTWRAYLSTTAAQGGKVVNARDRIGKGPWYNAKGVRVATNIDDLHTSPNLAKQTILTEKGTVVNGGGDTPNMHDILTGSDSQGRAIIGGTADTTCSNWTSGADTGSAMVGHSDRKGLRDDVAARSWNATHPSRGCSMPQLRASGGAGLFYCFAAR
jgi:hypothetical protein